MDNISDHVARLQATALGQHDQAAAIRDRIEQRKQSMAMRRGSSERRKRPSRWSSAFNVAGFAARGLVS
jgi:hypothetical protein